MPSAVRADPKVKIWIKAEVRQQTLTICLVAVHKTAVPKMKNPSRYIIYFAGYRSVVRTSPL